jgi:hypothetical protein
MIKMTGLHKLLMIIRAISPLAKGLFILSVLLIVDLIVTFPMSTHVRGLLLGSVVGVLISGVFVSYQNKGTQALEKKENALLSRVEESLETLQNVVDDVSLDYGTFAELDDGHVLALPDCAVVMGNSDKESYVIPSGQEAEDTPAGRALFSSLNVLKENGVHFKVLDPKSGNKALKKSSKSQWLRDGSNLSLNFPQNFVNLN